MCVYVWILFIYKWNMYIHIMYMCICIYTQCIHIHTDIYTHLIPFIYIYIYVYTHMYIILYSKSLSSCSNWMCCSISVTAFIWWSFPSSLGAYPGKSEAIVIGLSRFMDLLDPRTDLDRGGEWRWYLPWNLRILY